MSNRNVRIFFAALGAVLAGLSGYGLYFLVKSLIDALIAGNIVGALGFGLLTYIFYALLLIGFFVGLYFILVAITTKGIKDV